MLYLYNMEHIDSIIQAIIDNFDFAYMFVINVLTYLLIKFIDYINKDKNVTTLVKRICLLVSIVIVTVLYLLVDDVNTKVLINSAILSPVFYSWVLRPILKKFKIGYKEYDETLK